MSARLLTGEYDSHLLTSGVDMCVSLTIWLAWWVAILPVSHRLSVGGPILAFTNSFRVSSGVVLLPMVPRL